MVAVYIVSLGISSGVVGLFVRQAFVEQGYVPGFQSGVMLAVGMGALFATGQLAYLTFVKLFWPTRTSWALASEALSLAAAVVFVPALMNVAIPWPDPRLELVEPLIYLGAFVFLHAILKLFAFYSILRSEPGPRIGAFGWLACGSVTLLAAALTLNAWLTALEQARPLAPDEVRPYRIGGTFAYARLAPEGSLIQQTLTPTYNQRLTLRIAPPPNTSDEDPLERVYVTVDMKGDTSESFADWVPLGGDSWSQFRVPAENTPKNLRSATITWTARKAARWRRVMGIKPIVTSNRAILFSGPFTHVQRDPTTPPSLVVLVLDGLGADRMAGVGGYGRKTTPALDRLAESSITYPFAYTPAPESPAASVTLLTGLPPLRHGFLGSHRGPLAPHHTTLAEALRNSRYATAAFTESDRWDDLRFGEGIERGFECYDVAGGQPSSVLPVAPDRPSNQEVPPPVSQTQMTLDRARKWIENNLDVQYLAFVRLTELREPAMRDEYGPGFVTRGTRTPADVYDSALQFMDRQIGAFLRFLRDSNPQGTLCVLVTSTGGAPNVTPLPVTDSMLRVPLILSVPNVTAEKRNDLVGLEDVAPTLAKLLNVQLGPQAPRSDLLASTATRGTGYEPVSMFGDPLLLSIRDSRYRMVWSTQRSPFTQKSAGPPAAPALYDISRARPGVPPTDVASRNPELVRRWLDKLDRYYLLHSEDWIRNAGL